MNERHEQVNVNRRQPAPRIEAANLLATAALSPERRADLACLGEADIEWILNRTMSRAEADSLLGHGQHDAEDSRRHFETGAVRSKDADDTRYDLITPIGLEALARTYADGARKYSDFNWERGMPVHDLLNHAIRHLFRYLSGDRSEEHLPHAAWNVLAAIHSECLWPELNRGHLRGPGCTRPIDAEESK